MAFLALYCGLALINVVIQTVKSICTIKCSTFVSACVNALAYGLYVYVIVFTNSEGLSLFSKAIITAIANFTGVYIANFLFNKIFKSEVKWKVEVSIPNNLTEKFEEDLCVKNLEYYICGEGLGWTAFAVFCKTKEQSKRLKSILPNEAQYNIAECVKRL